MEGQSNSHSSARISHVNQHNAVSRETSVHNEHDAMNSVMGQSSPGLAQVDVELVPVEQEAHSRERNIRQRTEGASLSIVIPLEPLPQVPVLDITDIPQPRPPQTTGPHDQHSTAANDQPNSLVIPIWNPITNRTEYVNPGTDGVNHFRVHRHYSNRYQPILVPSPVARRMQHVRARVGRRRNMIDRQLADLPRPDQVPHESDFNLGRIMGGVTEGIVEQQEVGHVRRTTVIEDHILPHLEQRKHEPNEPGFPTPDELCCICQEKYVAGEDITRLDCRHDYHVQCITNWLIRSNSCPICKATGLAALERHR